MPVESGAESIMERQPAPQRLTVCVVQDELCPPTWWHSLLRSIDSHPHITLSRILISTAATLEPHSELGGEQPSPVSQLAKRLARTITHEIVDKPQLHYNPLERSRLEPCFQARTESVVALQTEKPDRLNTTLAYDGIDVIIQLRELPVPLDPGSPVRIWMPDLGQLRNRATTALTARDPFFRMNLLQQPTGDEGQTPQQTDWTLLADHTLPLQTFSITDLEIAAYACLPGLFMTQLNRLRLGHENAQTCTQDLDPVSVSSSHACADARTGQEFESTTSVQSSTLLLKQSLGLLWQQFRQRLRDRLYYEQWQIAVLSNLDVTDSIDDLTTTSMASYEPLTPPDRHSWADPHLASHDGSLHVFFEAINADENRGWINCARLKQGGFDQAPAKALISDHHLSYPFIFEHDHQHWMIPETSSEGTISLYRCVGFPDQWERVTHLMSDVNVADCTVLYRDGRWWLFGNTMTHPAVDERDELRIWFADDLTGPWQAHPLNPVLTGVHHARMAGGFLHSGGQLYRPSQYGGWRYGRAVNLARVDILTPENYRETLVGQISPPAGSPWLGCHSITHLDGVTLIDRVRRRSRLTPWIRTGRRV